MNTGLAGLLALIALLGYLLTRNRRMLLALWPVMFFGVPTLRNVVGSASLYWSDLTSLAVGLAFAREAAMRPGGLVMRRWYALFLGALLVGALSSVYRYGSVIEPGFWFVRYSLALLPVLVMPAVVADRRHQEHLFGGAVAAVVIMFSAAAMQWASQDLAVLTETLFYVDFNSLPTAFDSYAWRVGDWNVESINANRFNLRVYGNFGSPTTFAGASILAGLVVGVVGRWCDHVRAATIGVVVAVITALMTYSRHGILALALGFIVLSVVDRRRVVVKVCAVAVLLVGIFSVVSVDRLLDRIAAGSEEVDEIVGEETATGSLGLRLEAGPKDFLERLWRDPEVGYAGIGLGATEIVLEREENGPPPHPLAEKPLDGFASNSFLLMVYYAGFPLLLVTMAFFAVGASKTKAFAAPWRAAILASITICLVIIAADNYAFLQPSVWFGWSLLVSLSLGSAQARERTEPRDPAPMTATSFPTELAW